jgi:hypothetical protein
MTVLAPGHHLYPADDGAWRYSTPDGRFVRVTGDPVTLAAFQRVVHGVEAAGPEAADGVDPAAFTLLGELFAARGLLVGDTTAAAASEARVPRPVAVIAVDGDVPVSGAVARLLEGAAQVIQGSVDEDAIREADILISCAGWLPDARWRRFDRWCAAHGTAWHRLHAEDVRFFLGPLTVPGQTASYEDLRGRRLAASGVADELLRHWAYLDDPAQVPPPVRWPDDAGLAVLAGLLAHDVLTYLRAGTPAVRDSEIEVDVASARVAHHRVLPLPVTAAPVAG